MVEKELNTDKYGKLLWWGLGLVFVVVLYRNYILKTPVIKSKDNSNSDFSGTSAINVFTKPYTKAKDESGFSNLYQLGQFDKKESMQIKNFEQHDILGIRILDGIKYYNIINDKWIAEKDLVIPTNYEIKIQK